MRIRKLRLKEIGVFDDETLEFKPSAQADQAEIHILTGPNGCGKTTILVTLAGAFDNLQINPSQGRNSNFLAKRFRHFAPNGKGYQSEAAITFDEEKSVQLYGNPQTGQVAANAKAIPKLAEYKNLASNLGVKPFVPMVFAAFAYSGYRATQNQEIDAVRETKGNLLYLALEFNKIGVAPSYNLTLNQWLANSISKTALAEKEGNPNNKFAAVIKSLEEAISQIIGYEIHFRLQLEPFGLIVKAKGQELDFDVLPDGLRSIISWMGDLLMRVDSLKWQDDLPAFEKNLILFLDEIEVHLHPAWQRKVLPIVQKLFKNSQIFLSTHSPFVVNSVDGAWVYEFDFKENGSAYLREVSESKSSRSYETVLQDDFGIDEIFGLPTQQKLAQFYEQKAAFEAALKVNPQADGTALATFARELAQESVELQTIVMFEIRKLSKRLGRDISL